MKAGGARLPARLGRGTSRPLPAVGRGAGAPAPNRPRPRVYQPRIAAVHPGAVKREAPTRSHGRGPATGPELKELRAGGACPGAPTGAPRRPPAVHRWNNAHSATRAGVSSPRSLATLLGHTGDHGAHRGAPAGHHTGGCQPMTGPTHHTGAPPTDPTAPAGTPPAPTRRDRQRANRDDWQHQQLEREIGRYKADYARRWAGTRGPKRRSAL